MQGQKLSKEICVRELVHAVVLGTVVAMAMLLSFQARLPWLAWLREAPGAIRATGLAQGNDLGAVFCSYTLEARHQSLWSLHLTTKIIFIVTSSV